MGLGHGDGTIEHAIVKHTNDAIREAEHCRILGKEVCPHVYASTQSLYAMEQLFDLTSNQIATGPRMIYTMLKEKVWWRPDFALRERGWKQQLEKRFSITVPREIDEEVWCLTHGDPTVANLMCNKNAQLRLIDPRVADFMPSFRSVDCGKIMQSLLGWERVLANLEPTEWIDPPIFVENNVLWWTAVHAVRINYRESRRKTPRTDILAWSLHVSMECGRASGF